MFENDFFINAPQEFFASIANQYFANSKHTLDLALTRFENGYKEPLNQFLFFADVYSLGENHTFFYTMATQGHIERRDVVLERDGNGFINSLYVDENHYLFSHDEQGRVVEISTRDVSETRQFNFKKGLFGEFPSLKVWVINKNRETGEVAISGVDTRQPTIPFTWEWGDGTTSQGWFPQEHTYFDESLFEDISKSTLEYILTLIASIQKDFVNDNVYLIDGNFEQVILRDPPFQGMYSLWYTNPVGIGVGDYGLQGTIQYSSLMHEIGHNFTLNTPSNYYYGGKIDGNANAIFSESMAQIFQHATAYEMLNNAISYGLSEDIVVELKQSAVSSILVMRNAYEDYRSDMRFSSWNDLSTPEDETFNTFMTIAYVFCAYAENTGLGYKAPLKRMMKLLQTFDERLRRGYNQHNNTASADTFRATLMVTALSYGFSTDLRTEFRSLNFPISDEVS